jgi:hypothetical protein
LRAVYGSIRQQKEKMAANFRCSYCRCGPKFLYWGKLMNKHIPQNPTVFLMLVALVTIAGCASGPSIHTNADPAVDFMSINTFGFMRPLSTDSGNVQSLLSTQLIAATTDELEKRGWRVDQNNPDVLINFLFETQEQIRSRNVSLSASRHRSGRYGGWGGTMSTPSIEQTTQGALSIDVIDPSQNQMIWEGTATNRVTDRLRENQAESVRTFVAAILADFP